MVPDPIASYFTALGTLAELPVQLPVGLEPCGLITVADRPITTATVCLMDMLRSTARLLSSPDKALLPSELSSTAIRKRDRMMSSSD